MRGGLKFRRSPNGEVVHVILGGGCFAVCGMSAVDERGTVSRLCANCRAWLETHGGETFDELEPVASSAVAA